MGRGKGFGVIIHYLNVDPNQYIDQYSKIIAIYKSQLYNYRWTTHASAEKKILEILSLSLLHRLGFGDRGKSGKLV